MTRFAQGNLFLLDLNARTLGSSSTSFQCPGRMNRQTASEAPTGSPDSPT